MILLKNNDIKKMLIEASNKQDIHDLNDNIISNVDTSKVVVRTKESRKLRLLPFSFAGALSVIVAVCIGIGIGSAINHNKIDSISPEEITVEDITKEMTYEYLTGVYAKEYYNLVNISYALPSLNTTSISKSTSKTLSQDEEKALVASIDMYVLNLDSMFDKANTQTTYYTSNTNTLYDYENDMIVDSSYYNYHVYYTEKILEEKNENGVNYKMNATTSGIIVIDENKYLFTGTEYIKNGKINFTTEIVVNDSETVLIKETFAQNINEFTYTFKTNDMVTNIIDVVQKMDDSGNTTVVKTNHSWINGTYIDSKTNGESDDQTIEVDFTLGDTNYIDGKIKSKNGDYIYINKNNNEFNYEFKNSLNKY